MRKALLLFVISVMLSSAYAQRAIWSQATAASNMQESISCDCSNGVYTYKKIISGKLYISHRVSFYGGLSDNHKIVYKYDSLNRLIEETHYGYPYREIREHDTLGSDNKYSFNESDKQVTDRIKSLLGNDPYQLQHLEIDPLGVSYIFKLRSYQYDYTNEYKLRKDSVYNYNIVERYKYKGEPGVYPEIVGRYKDPELTFSYCLFKRNKRTPFQCEGKFINVGKR